MSVESIKPEVETMKKRWELPLTLLGGTQAMRAAATKYLPIEGQLVGGEWIGESNEAYQRRLSRTTLFNAYARAVNGLRGKVFSKPILINHQSHELFHEWADNIDLEGNNITVFAYDVFRDALVYGHCFILADMPESGEINRPYLKKISPENVIGWEFQNIDGVKTLVSLRLSESVTKVEDFEETTVNQIRHITPLSVEIYQEGDSGWDIIQVATNELGFIPISVVYTEKTGDFTSTPPLLDLAYKNLEHWQSSSDQKNILHVARVPILFGAGFQTEQITVSSSSMILESDPAAKLTYVEHSGAAIGSGFRDLDLIKEEMRALSLEPMISRTGGTTATARALDEAEANSLLQSWSLRLQDGLTEAMSHMAAWAGIDYEPLLEVNTKYSLSLDRNDDIKVLIELNKMGILDSDNLLNELMSHELLSEDFDIDSNSRNVVESDD